MYRYQTPLHTFLVLIVVHTRAYLRTCSTPSICMTIGYPEITQTDDLNIHPPFLISDPHLPKVGTAPPSTFNINLY